MMALSDLANVFQWWLILFLTGIIFLPFTILLFNTFFDKGYAFAKILGLLILSYSIWLLSSLKILPFTSVSIFILWLILAILSSILSFKKNLWSDYKKVRRIFIAEELVFLVGLLFWSYIRAHEPSIHGLEKFMDFGFINSILRTDYFPPKDMWMTPLSINYYYFGHLVTAVIIKISGITPAVGYNLMLATLFGLTLSASFSLGANLYHFFSDHLHPRQLLLSGIFSSFLITLGGNLHTIYAFFQNYPDNENPIPFWTLPFINNFSGYWYPNATRFIPKTIHEFPIYSFVVSDLHGHVLNIPFVLLTLALLIKIFHSPKIPNTYYLMFSLLIAVFLMTNVLDGPIYLLVIFAVLLAKKLPLHQAGKNTFLVALGGIVFSLPFWFSFKPFGAGIGLACSPDFLINIGRIGPLLFEADHCARSPFWMLVILWGFFYFVFFGFLFFILRPKLLPNPLSSILKKPSSIFHLPSSNTDLLVLTLALSATILIIIPEFFYVKDIYPVHYRANTVFKFGYQTFIIFGLISGYMMIRIFQAKQHIACRFIIIALFFLVAIYPYFAVNSYYNGLKKYQSLDGLSYLSNLYPTDYQAILWIRENIKGPAVGPLRFSEASGRQPVILEAQGDSYTDYARVSSNTGLPTVIGWPVHEWLWRGSYDEAGKRSAEVTTLYESPDETLTESLLRKYKVSYVFIGTLERQKYLQLNESKFTQLGKIVFQSGETRIYQLGL